MKQHITKEQWADLVGIHQEQLKNWWLDSRTISGTIMSKGDHHSELVFSGGGHAPGGQENELLVVDKGECCFQQNLRDEKDWEGDWIPWSKCKPLLNIGQMIEFLGDQFNDWGINYMDTTCDWLVYNGYPPNIEEPKEKWRCDELCDALWEAVKQKLK